jgi:hypothetical protein
MTSPLFDLQMSNRVLPSATSLFVDQLPREPRRTSFQPSGTSLIPHRLCLFFFWSLSRSWFPWYDFG